VPDPVGLGPRSLIRADHFGAAMAKLRRAHLGHVKYVRVSPEQINVQLITDSGRIRELKKFIDWNNLVSALPARPAWCWTRPRSAPSPFGSKWVR